MVDQVNHVLHSILEMIHPPLLVCITPFFVSILGIRHIAHFFPQLQQSIVAEQLQKSNYCVIWLKQYKSLNLSCMVDNVLLGILDILFHLPFIMYYTFVVQIAHFCERLRKETVAEQLTRTNYGFFDKIQVSVFINYHIYHYLYGA